MGRLTYEKLCEILQHVNRVTFILDGVGEESHSSQEVHEAIKELQRYKDLEEQGRLIEVKYGRWILVNSDVDWYLLECSACKHQITEYGDSNSAKYCPNCGAKMELKELEGDKE